ncbi:putative glutaredoxin-like protein [Babesia divergens]|uniref:Glutaredoxin-like protein n=1 Tax=Babesia divergens TaxID=32595 RepID=A0AAD9GAF4_BABDI|nr:putative glutaredoxin-like protein [Babesia divergens]
MNIYASLLLFTIIRIRCLRMDANHVQKWVRDRVGANKVVVFSKIQCPFCVKANGILSEMVPDDLTIFQLDDNPDRQKIMEYFGRTTGAATVPRVFIGGEFYGDCSKVVSEYCPHVYLFQVSTKDSGALRATLLAAGCNVTNLRGGPN